MIRIGLPLDGWDLAVVGQDGEHVEHGQTGELIIGGVGLARYLDPAKDAEKYAPMPSLGWDRAYRSGDLVVYDEEGLLFGGRADDQVKLGGRRIELGEVDNALGDLPGVIGAAAAIRHSAAGTPLLVGYVVADDTYEQSVAMRELRSRMPPSLVPRLAKVETLPTRTSGKIDREALPWPVDVSDSSTGPPIELSGTQAWVAELWLRHPRRRSLQHRRGLLRPWWREPDVGSAGIETAVEVSRGDGRRRLRASDRGQARSDSRSDGQPNHAHQPQGPPDATQDPDGSDRVQPAATDRRRPAVADLDCGRSQRGLERSRSSVASDRVVVVGR